MNFVDEAEIEVKGGKGGDGIISFRSEKFVEFGGPDGGDGGDGGSIWLIGDTNIGTLQNFLSSRFFSAQNGEKGKPKNGRGRSGEDLTLRVPLGTIVHDSLTKRPICEVIRQGSPIKVAQGGFHGLGNARFTTSIDRAPRKFSNGSRGEQKILRLSLKVLAEVGLLGLPNAGKSSILKSCSGRSVKVANYPFTTLIPQLGVVKVGEKGYFTLADLPGLIGGAARGKGLGHRFLRHIERCLILLHIVDISLDNPQQILENIKTVESELEEYSPKLARRKTILLLNKCDLLTIDEIEEKLELVKQNVYPKLTLLVSAFRPRLLEQIKRAVFQMVCDLKDRVDEPIDLK